MMNFRTLLRPALAAGVLLSLAALPAAPAAAAVGVGDTPALRVNAAGGGTIDLAALKGKIVVLDFWATWCGPCMAEAPHMVGLYQKYHEQGLEIIGISLDSSDAVMLPVAKENGLIWPQHVDADKSIRREFGVDSIPRVFVIGPDGQVLWTGHPANLDAPLADAFAKHPPRLVDEKTLAAAVAAADSADKLLATGDAAGALRAYAAVPPEAGKDKQFAEREAALSGKLTAAADGLLAEVDAMVADGKYAQASARMAELSESLKGTPAADKAKAKRAELSADPKVKAALAAADRQASAAALLAVAARLESDKKPMPAYQRYQECAQKFADTDAGKTAGEAVARYESDPAFKAQALDAAAGTKAKGQLGLARSYLAAGRPQLAAEKLKGIIADYPGTSYAAEAQAELDKIK